MGVLLQGTPRLSISCKQASEFFQWKLWELRSPREQPHHQHTQEGDHEGQPKGQVANCQQAESNLSLPVGGGVNSGGVDQTTRSFDNTNFISRRETASPFSRPLVMAETTSLLASDRSCGGGVGGKYSHSWQQPLVSVSQLKEQQSSSCLVSHREEEEEG